MSQDNPTLIDIRVRVPIPGVVNPDSLIAEMTLEEARQLVVDLQAALPYKKKNRPTKPAAKPKTK